MKMKKSKRLLYQLISVEESNHIKLPQKIDDMSISIIIFASHLAFVPSVLVPSIIRKILSPSFSLTGSSNSLENHNMSTKQPCLFIIRHQQRGRGRNGHRGQQLVQTCFGCLGSAKFKMNSVSSDLLSVFKQQVTLKKLVHKHMHIHIYINAHIYSMVCICIYINTYIYSVYVLLIQKALYPFLYQDFRLPFVWMQTI